MGEWDNNMKRLVRDFVQDYVSYLVDGAVFVSELNAHLPSRSIDADTLLKVKRTRHPFMVHIEYQARVSQGVPLRVCEYSLQATRKYKLPAISFVFYLQRGGHVPQSPFVIEVKGIEQVHNFNYHPIEVYNITSEELSNLGLPGLLPLLPLTRDGARPQVVEKFIAEVQQVKDTSKRENLFAAGLNFASLAFGKDGDQDWLLRRFYMLDDDVLNNTPLALHIQKIGADKARQEELVRQRQTLAAIVQAHFPSLVDLAEKQAANMDKPDVINLLIVQISIAKSEQEAREYLQQAVKKRRKRV